MITDLKKGITVRCRVPMQKQMKNEDGSRTTYTGYCDSSEWIYEHTETVRHGDSSVMRKITSKTTIPFCKNGHPLGGLRRPN